MFWNYFKTRTFGQSQIWTIRPVYVHLLKWLLIWTHVKELFKKMIFYLTTKVGQRWSISVYHSAVTLCVCCPAPPTDLWNKLWGDQLLILEPLQAQAEQTEAWHHFEISSPCVCVSVCDIQSPENWFPTSQGRYAKERRRFGHSLDGDLEKDPGTGNKHPPLSS